MQLMISTITIIVARTQQKARNSRWMIDKRPRINSAILSSQKLRSKLRLETGKIALMPSQPKVVLQSCRLPALPQPGESSCAAGCDTVTEQHHSSRDVRRSIHERRFQSGPSAMSRNEPQNVLETAFGRRERPWLLPYVRAACIARTSDEMSRKMDFSY